MRGDRQLYGAHDAASSIGATFRLSPATLTVVKAGNWRGAVTSLPAGVSCDLPAARFVVTKCLDAECGAFD